MRGLVLAWAVGLGIYTWRTVQEFRKPPVPGRVLGASLVYAGLALVAEYEPARRAATAAAWGFDLAVLFKAGPAQLTQGAGWITGQQGKGGQQVAAGQGGGTGKRRP
jgi:hypothetical protein